MANKQHFGEYNEKNTDVNYITQHTFSRILQGKLVRRAVRCRMVGDIRPRVGYSHWSVGDRRIADRKKELYLPRM